MLLLPAYIARKKKKQTGEIKAVNYLVSEGTVPF